MWKLESVFVAGFVATAWVPGATLSERSFERVLEEVLGVPRGPKVSARWHLVQNCFAEVATSYKDAGAHDIFSCALHPADFLILKKLTQSGWSEPMGDRRHQV